MDFEGYEPYIVIIIAALITGAIYWIAQAVQGKGYVDADRNVHLDKKGYCMPKPYPNYHCPRFCLNTDDGVYTYPGCRI